MLYYSTVDMLLSKTDKVEFQDRLLQLPHYVCNLSLFNGHGLDKSKVSFEDITLPHTQMFLTALDDLQNNSLAEMCIMLMEEKDHILVLAKYNFKLYPHIVESISGKLKKADSGHAVFDITESTIKVDPKKDPDEADRQVTNYIYNVVVNFNHCINKVKDIREGVETRSRRIFKDRKGKKAYGNFTLIHMGSHKALSKDGYKSNNIAWNNSWVVRGHWRYYKDKTKLCKGRTGEINELGRSWIQPYQKQVQLELSNKPRVLGR